MADLFDKDQYTISEHIQNIFKKNELDQIATNRKFRSIQQEGNRNITREREHYNLDVIISVGYRVKSKLSPRPRTFIQLLYRPPSFVSHTQ